MAAVLTGGLEALRDTDPARVGTYSLLARLRESASATEYVGRGADADTVSVRVPHPRLAGSPALSGKFRSEGELAARAAGPWVAAVREAEDGHLVTAYRPAVSLAAAVAGHGPLPEHAVRVLGAALAEVLTRLRPLVPVHQGLAPHTVLLAADGPVLAGFGPLAAATEVGVDGPGTGLRLSLGFLTPEQVARRAPGPASDVFVLGLLLVYAATGGSPFGPSAPVTPDVIAAAEADLGGAGVPERLRPLLSRCLDKDPARRPEPEVIAAGLAPGGVAGLVREGWLPGAVVAGLSQQAADVLGLEVPERGTVGAADGVAGGGAKAGASVSPQEPRMPPVPGVAPSAAETRVDPAQDQGQPQRPPRSSAPARLLSRRTLLAGAAGVVVGAGVAVPLARSVGGGRRSARTVAAGARRVAGTAPTALWHFKATTQTSGHPLVWRDEVLVVPTVSNTAGIDLRTGKVRWTKPFTCHYGLATAHGDLLIAQTDRGLTRFSAETGTIRDTVRKYAQDESVQAFVGQTGERVWCTVDGADGLHLVCYDTKENDEVWRAKLPQDYPKEARVALGKKTVYVQRFPDPTDDLAKGIKGKARFLALDRGTGEKRWEKSYGKVMAKDHAWPTAEGVLYADEDSTLTAYGLESGKRLWRYKNEFGDTVATPRAVVRRGDSLYAVDKGRTMFSVNPRDGASRWVSRPPDDEIITNDYMDMAAGPPGAPLYCLSWAGVTAVDPESGKKLWVFQGVGEQENDGLGWKVYSGTKTAVFARGTGKHYFALPVG
ncbi:PQQ-binding-like beta-propeller repeat protein [Actinomycetota bacterium Odt1-20B]